MQKMKTMRARVGGAIAVGGVALILAACGSSSSASSTTTASGAGSAGTTTASQTSGAKPASTNVGAGKAVSLSTASGSLGTHLVGAGGRTVYLWQADTNGMSSCSGACAQAWPPVLTKGAPKASSGVTASDLGTTTRSDGTKQVTYKGHPLYYFVQDTTAGATSGQGSAAFGAKWFVVAPSGAAITGSGSGSSGSTTSSSGSSAGGTSTGGGGAASWS